MNCKCESHPGGDGPRDYVQVEDGRRWVADSKTQWLAAQAIRHLNGAGREDEAYYAHAVALLREQEDAADALVRLAHQTVGDPTLRWNLLHLLGDAGNASSAGYLVEAAIERLPERSREGCEGPFDTELLNRTMAVHAIAAIATREREVAGQLLRIVEANPERAVLVEAVKAAADAGLQDRVRELLPQEHHWMLDLKRVNHQQVQADPGRKDEVDGRFRPPAQDAARQVPQACGFTRKE
ncbi:hypothetical protein E5843_14465 [Luteimonas yindakuii]|uniref:hypothetical protein n=1 Tax=Luteimonas yindakuii TaxID=2565782 RepID=UPI001107952A|nr:hypothetical protein [Luteimonas yindakuii]QCU72530.1 hypothetical protein E5843_14465 [Luteimonas yindakuii]